MKYIVTALVQLEIEASSPEFAESNALSDLFRGNSVESVAFKSTKEIKAGK